MFNLGQNNANMPTGTVTGGFNPSSGVYNEFAAPTVDDGRSTKRDTVKLFLISVLILTLFLAAASYFYAQYLASQVDAKKASLTNLDNNPNIVQFETNLPAMRDLSKKLKLLNSVNDSRMYISGMLFPILESVVESSRNSYVYFKRIDVKKDNVNNGMSVSLSGVAQDYLALSRQLTNFKSGPMSSYFQNFKFISLSLDTSGQVLFDISFNIDISTNSYLKYLKSQSGTDQVNKNSSGPLFKNDAPANVFASSTASSTNNISTTSKSKTN